MKLKSLILSLGFVGLVSAHFAIAEEGDEAKAKEKSPPSEEVKKATKKSKPFDPQAYGCQDFVKTLQGDGNEEMLGVSIIWLHGYFSSAYGTDEMGALNETNIMEIAQDTAEFCEENPDLNFSRAAKKIYEDE